MPPFVFLRIDSGRSLPVNFENKKQLSNLTLNNIEALASGEDDPSIYCIGDGSIDCNGRKVRATYKPYSFEYLK